MSIMDKVALDHISMLEKHGAQVFTAAGKRPVTRWFYRSILLFCEQYGINCLAYDMKIPETDEPMMLAIWRNGHVDSGSADHIHAVMDQ